jgi:ABC-2 type transport system ATP-binding protein
MCPLLTSKRNYPSQVITVIEIVNLCKSYGKVDALVDLNLKIKKGEVFGFIGPNGAGKTTTIKILATLTAPSSGEAYVSGYDVTEEPYKVRGLIGYMPDFFGMYDSLKVWEYLDFFASSYRMPHAERKDAIENVLSLTRLEEKAEGFVAGLSRGMRQRLCLAKTLLHDPELLILDEPASGLDPRARVEIKELLRGLKDAGKTIFVSSHILPELSDICTTFGIIEKGNLLLSGSKEKIMEAIRGVRSIKTKVLSDTKKAASLIESEKGVGSIKIDGKEVQFEFNGSDLELARVFENLVTEGVLIVGFSELETNLEDVFMKITRGELA